MSNQIDEIQCSSSSDKGSDFEFIDEDFLTEASSIPKLQHREIVIKACWDDNLYMSEVLEHKGGLLISMGIAGKGKVYLSIEETLYLAEIGALMLVDEEGTTLQLKDIYEKVAAEKDGCSWEHFVVYKHLKSLGYIVGRHNIPWSLKSFKRFSIPLEGTALEDKAVPTVMGGTSIAELLKDLHIKEKELLFDIYLPNSKFRKTAPGDPEYIVSLARHYTPSIIDIEELQRHCNGIPLKIAHVDHGRVSGFSFEQANLPTLP